MNTDQTPISPKREKFTRGDKKNRPGRTNGPGSVQALHDARPAGPRQPSFYNDQFTLTSFAETDQKGYTGPTWADTFDKGPSKSSSMSPNQSRSSSITVDVSNSRAMSLSFWEKIGLAGPPSTGATEKPARCSSPDSYGEK